MSAPRRARGGQPVADEDRRRRDLALVVRLSPRERERYNALAEQLRVTLPELVRALLDREAGYDRRTLLAESPPPDGPDVAG